MADSGSALMGIGYATGENRAKEAAERALRSPLIETEITGARGILLSIAGGDDLTLYEVNEAAEAVREAATDDTNIIFGATIDDRLDGPDVDHRRRDRHRRPPARPPRDVRHRASGSSGEVLEPPSFLRDSLDYRLDQVDRQSEDGRAECCRERRRRADRRQARRPATHGGVGARSR